VVQREEVFQKEAARLEAQHLESQLDELRAAFAEKTALLEQLHQTSTPIAPVVEGILVVPLVGTVDAARTELLTERLLQAVTQARAQVVILDISGVPGFDAVAAALIVRLGQAVRLLGAELIVVGMAPATARTIVELGVELAGLRALGSLQDGLALALRLRRLTIAPL
jgi:anti-anti-sigma factor